MIKTNELFKLIEDYLFIFSSKEDAIKYLFNDNIDSFTKVEREDIEKIVNNNLSLYLKKQFEEQKLKKIVEKYLGNKKTINTKDITFINNMIINSTYDLTYDDLEELLKIKSIEKYIKKNSDEEIELVESLKEFQQILKEEDNKEDEYIDHSDMYALYRNDFKDFELLDAEEEKELLRRYKLENDEEAFSQLVYCNQRLCEKIAKRYINRGLPLLDLIQEGNLGLIKGIMRFDIERGNKLSTYVTWWINHMIQNATIKEGPIIRIPNNMVEDQNKLARIENTYRNENGIDPSLEELTELSGFPLKKVEYLKLHQIEMVSFDKQIPTEDDTGSTYGEFIKSDEESPEEAMERIERAKLFDEYLTRIGNDRKLQNSKRLEQIARLRLGIDVYNKITYKLLKAKNVEVKERYTLEEIAKMFNITREGIRQLEKRAFDILIKYGIDREDLLFPGNRLRPVTSKEQKALKKLKKKQEE